MLWRPLLPPQSPTGTLVVFLAGPALCARAIDSEVSYVRLETVLTAKALLQRLDRLDVDVVDAATNATNEMLVIFLERQVVLSDGMTQMDMPNDAHLFEYLQIAVNGGGIDPWKPNLYFVGDLLGGYMVLAGANGFEDQLSLRCDPATALSQLIY